MKKILLSGFCFILLHNAANAVSCVLSGNNALPSATVIAQSNNAIEYQNCTNIVVSNSIMNTSPIWYVYSCGGCKSGTQAKVITGKIPSNQQTTQCTVCATCTNSGSCQAGAEVCSNETGICRITKKNTSDDQCATYCPSQSPTYECAAGWYRTENWNSVPNGTKYCWAEGKGGSDYNCSGSIGSTNQAVCRKCSQYTGNANSTSDKGDNTAITKCYLPAKTDCSDASGKCELGSKCYYTN